MTAADAVFTTYELLEQIITFLPPKDIGRASRVCQQWRQLVGRSKNIRQRHTIRPVPQWITTVFSPGYYYLGSAGITFNAMLQPDHNKFSRKVLLVIPLSYLRHPVERAKREGQYVSDPPVTTLSVDHGFRRAVGGPMGSEYSTACAVRKAGGATVGDLLDVGYAIEESAKIHGGSGEKTQRGWRSAVAHA